MESSTRDQLNDHLAALPEEYFALAACFISAVHDVVSGKPLGHEERLQRMADSYLVLVLESIRGDRLRHFVSPGVIRYMAHRFASEDRELSMTAHRGEVVEMVFQQFEERLWLTVRDMFDGVIPLPSHGPVDLLCPVLGMTLTEAGASVLCFDDIPSLKKSASAALRKARPEKVLTAVVTFVENMVVMTEGKAASSVSRTRLSLVAFLEYMIPQMTGAFHPRACALLERLNDGSTSFPSSVTSRVLN